MMHCHFSVHGQLLNITCCETAFGTAAFSRCVLCLFVSRLPMTICDQEPHVQGSSAGSDAWPVSYETVGSSYRIVERRAPSMSKLSLIRSLCDQLKGTQQELKTVTAKVDVALSKASRAMDAEKFLLEEIKNLGKAMKCKSFELLNCFAPG
jgi:hypothetical protein